jgi:sugar/nucleoside kinase (ribokinase family)
MSQVTDYDVFVSHNLKDKEWVRDFVLLLRSQGLNVFFDEDSIEYGTDIVSAIETAIEQSKYVLLVISPNSIASPWVALEASITIYSDPDAQSKKLIPLRLEQTPFEKIKPSIRRLSMVDLTLPEKRSDSLGRLLKQIGITRPEALRLPRWPSDDRSFSDAILVIGSGVGENVLTVDSEVRLGEKHIVNRYELLGGSGLNYTFRLSCTGHPVLPILSIGRDLLGHKIQREIAKTLNENQILQFLDYVESERLFCDELTTPQSTIIVSEDKRTIFTETMQGVHNFKDFALNRIEELQGYQNAIKAVMIGHIYADNPGLNPAEPGEITKAIIENFFGKTLIFANFGESQLCLGDSFWKEHLSKIDVFQLSLSEVRKFFSNNNEVSSLTDIISWFRRNCTTAIITLDKFGAVATFKDGRDGVILSWPYELDNILDSTGAGDAFGAGLISMLYKKQVIEFYDFLSAIRRARVWAAYACTTIGGAKDCPNNVALQTFETEVMKREFNPVEVRNLNHADLVLRLLDKAY